MTDAYQDTMQPLGDAMRQKAALLADYLVTQPRRMDAVKAVLDFGWWCLGEGAKHAHDVQERMHRVQLARQSAGAHSGE